MLGSGPVCVEFGFSPWFCVAFLQLVQRPPTVMQSVMQIMQSTVNRLSQIARKCEWLHVSMSQPCDQQAREWSRVYPVSPPMALGEAPATMHGTSLSQWMECLGVLAISSGHCKYITLDK